MSMPSSSSASRPELSCIVADEVAHLVERLRGRLDDDVDAVAEHVELEVGDEGRDLDEGVGLEVEPGHLAVDPHQVFIHGRHFTAYGRSSLAWLTRVRPASGGAGPTGVDAERPFPQATHVPGLADVLRRSPP